MNKLKLLSAGVISALMLSSCTTSLSLDSEVKLPENYYGLMTEEENLEELTSWWEKWQDPVLNRLIRDAVAGNMTIKVAQEKLLMAYHESEAAGADLGPQAFLSLGGGLGYQKADNPLPKPFGHGESEDSKPKGGFLSGGISWEPDIFGQKQSTSDAAKYRMLAVSDQVNLAKMEIAAKVAEYYFQILALKEQDKVLDKSLENWKNMRRYVNGRFEAGQATAYDLTNIDSYIAKTKADKALISASENALLRGIAVLSGKLPDSISLSELPEIMPVLPALPKGAKPASLLSRRPDILSKANEIKAKAALVASAEADLYPRFNIQFLSGLGRLDIDAGTGFSPLNAWTNLLTAGVSLPIFTNGRIRENIEAKKADAKAALHEYDELLLKALLEVENNYEKGVAYDKERVDLEKSYAATTKLTSDATKLFEHGMKEYDSVVTAKGRELSLAHDLVNNRLSAHLSRIAIYKALGGGWDPNDSKFKTSEKK